MELKKKRNVDVSVDSFFDRNYNVEEPKLVCHCSFWDTQDQATIFCAYCF